MNIKLVVGAVLCILLCGCEETLTYKAWHQTEATYCGPAADPHVQLFQRTNIPPDVVVSYIERSERSGKERKRVFVLNQNEQRLINRQKPIFTNISKLGTLKPIPVYKIDSQGCDPGPTTRNGSAGLFAETDGPTITLYSENTVPVTYYLPDYFDQHTLAKRMVLVPLAMTGDVVVGAVIVGAFAAYAYAQSGAYGHTCR